MAYMAAGRFFLPGWAEIFGEGRQMGQPRGRVVACGLGAPRKGPWKCVIDAQHCYCMLFQWVMVDKHTWSTHISDTPIFMTLCNFMNSIWSSVNRCLGKLCEDVTKFRLWQNRWMAFWYLLISITFATRKSAKIYHISKTLCESAITTRGPRTPPGLADHGQRVGTAVPGGRISAAQEPAARAGAGAFVYPKHGMGWDWKMTGIYWDNMKWQQRRYKFQWLAFIFSIGLNDSLGNAQMKRESHESSFQLAGVSRPFGKVSAGVGIASHLNHLVASFGVPSLPGLLISYTSYK